MRLASVPDAADSPAAVVQPRSDDPREALLELDTSGLHVPASLDWMLDASVEIEIRTAIDIIYRLAFLEAVQRNDSYKTFGTTPVSVATKFDILQSLTGWNRPLLARVISAAENRRLLKLTGSKRTGYRYHILFAMRSYRRADSEPARRMFAPDRKAQPSRPRRAQIGLGESFSSPHEPEQASILGPSDEPKDGQRSSPDELRNAGFSSSDAVNSPTFSSTSEPKEEATNVRACDPRVTSRNTTKDNGRGTLLPPELEKRVLELARKRDPGIERTSLSFESMIATIIAQIDTRFPGEAVTVLSRLVQDPRVTTAENPIGALLVGTGRESPKRPNAGFLLQPIAVVTTRTPSEATPEAAYTSLPQPVRDLLEDAIESGRATAAWCRERDIPPGALAHAKERRQVASPDEPQLDAGALARMIAERFPDDVRGAVEAAIADGRISPMLAYGLRDCDVVANGDTVTLVAPSPFLMQMLRAKALPVIQAGCARVICVDIDSDGTQRDPRP